MWKRKSKNPKSKNGVDTKLEDVSASQLQNNTNEATNESLEGPDYVQMSTAYGPPTKHFLNLVSAKMDSGNDSSIKTPNFLGDSAVEVETSVLETVKVYVCLNVLYIRDISTSDSSFNARVRLYLSWRPKYNRDNSDHKPFLAMAEHARKTGKYHNLNSKEVEAFHEAITVPKIKFFNAFEVEETDEAASVRIYGTNGGLTMLNRGYTITCRELFELWNFPFDYQDLQIELRQDDSRLWHHFDLVVCAVTFHRNALELVEWTPYEPKVEHKSTTSTVVNLRVKRVARFYVINIVAVLFILSVLAFVVFALPDDALGERVNLVLTLLLTAVAFKFAIADVIPKVGYSTLLDHYVMDNIIFLFFVTFVCTITSILESRGVQSCLESVSLNTQAGLVCMVGLIVINGLWLRKVLAAEGEMAKEKRLVVRNDQPWYTCVFANVSFFDPKLVPKYE